MLLFFCWIKRFSGSTPVTSMIPKVTETELVLLGMIVRKLIRVWSRHTSSRVLSMWSDTTKFGNGPFVTCYRPS